MRRLEKGLWKPLAVILAIVLVACAASIPAAERWGIRVMSTDGQYVGGLILELTSEPASGSCAGVTDMMKAQIIEKHGFTDDYVRDEVAIRLKDGQLYADLSVGACDHTLIISRTVQGSRAIGDASRSTLVGAMKVGRFTAEKL